MVTFKDESCVDLTVRGYSHIEGLVRLCVDNGYPVDFEETVGDTNCFIDQTILVDLKEKRPLFPQRVTQKMQSVVIQSGQNVVDLALQETGSIEGLVALLNLNGLAINSVLVPGNELKTKTVEVVSEEVRSFYNDLNYKVNTGDQEDVPINVRLLEDGSYRLLEDGSYRLLE